MASSYFAGKVAIVTGSSQGIGRATAKMLASLGAKVTITGRNEQALNETKSLMTSAGAKPEDIVSVIGNIQEEAVYTKIIEDTVNKFGKIDVLINNAGSLNKDNSQNAGLTGLDDYDYTMNLNVRSVVALTKLALPYLIKTKGSVVMVSSIASNLASTNFPYYAMSKAAIDRLTQSLALSYIEKGVRVNAVNPGWTLTAIMEKLGMKREQIDAFEAKETVNRQQIPIGRAAQPSEVAELILFLADTSKSEYIIGQCIIIDGGRSLARNMINPANSKWRGSVWKAVCFQYAVWIILFFLVSLIYRFLLTENQQETFVTMVDFINSRLNYIPLDLMLGFFVAGVLTRFWYLYNIIRWEVKKFRTDLAWLCNYDWVPLPIIYPSIVCLAVHMYFLVCLIARQYVDGSVIEADQNIAQRYKKIRRTRGDGACYWRCLMISIIEKCAAEPTYCHKVKEICEYYLKKLVELGYEHLTVEDFISALQEAIDKILDNKTEEIFKTIEDQSYHMYYVSALKFITVGYILEHAEEYEMNAIAEGFNTLKEYIDPRIQVFEAPADDIAITASARAFDLNIRIEYVTHDNHPMSQKGSYYLLPYDDENAIYSVFLLWRPEHYDILYVE